MAKYRYTKTMKPFLARFNEEQRIKLQNVSTKLGVSEAEALRVLVDHYPL